MLQLVQKIVLFTLSLGVSLGLGEVLIRALSLAPEVVYIEKWRVRLSSNPDIGYEPIPYLDGTGKSLQFYSYNDKSNFMGFRDIDWELSKPEGVHRIALVGDSVAEGLWISERKDILTYKLNEALKASPTPYEVMNFAVSGYNTKQEVATIKEKVLPFKPDTIVVAYCLNDVREDNGNILGHLLHEEHNSKSTNTSALSAHAVSTFSLKSHLLRFLNYRVLAELSNKIDQQKQESYISDTTNQKYNDLKEDTVYESLAELSEVAKKNSITVLLVIFPDFTQIDKNIFENEFANEHKRISSYAKEFNFDYIDLFDEFVECKKQDPYHLLSFDKYHMRPEGHTCAAHALYKYFNTNHFITNNVTGNLTANFSYGE